MEIFDAIKSGDLEKVKEIVTHNPSEINATDENGISAVLTAAYYRQTSILDELLSRGPSINIFEAVVIGDMENLKRWLAKDQSLIGIHSKDGFSLLGLASYFGL